MSDLVVTVPKGLWREWLAEGDAAGEPWSGQQWAFNTGGGVPPSWAGERLYIVAWGLLRGYAPIIDIAPRPEHRGWAIIRGGGAEAVTLRIASPCDLCSQPAGMVPIRGFRGWRKRWWPRDIEVPFPDWKTEGVSG